MKKIGINLISKSNHSIFIGFIIFILLLGISLGVYLNKIYPDSTSYIMEYISRTSNYYTDSSYSVLNLMYINGKNDFFYLLSLLVLSLGVFTWPLALLVIFLKGVSVGFTVSTLVIGFNFSYLKMIFFVLVKNIVIMPFSIVVMVVLFNYVKNAFSAIKMSRKFKNKYYITRLAKKYIINSMAIIIPAVLVQGFINGILIFITQRIF
ncbi:hypothetical protein SAMN05661008_00664 [Alkalithermobacter thermoalcaliphilus JW-YL-7 = DSM 7308]|uniref:Stage II sporulation protein M n=1 Tax=Alkalithermobacter thermoalcaliphilus JW-YL-7 = DSM 7308 TaxID=1121328 RepID=A0A150FPV7_CLOPD|nr:hypothetical protein JWYL7_0734 [[Clostridium] paradoxum JW-YL-7 = DSM 7308]SHK65624.1 hypothetical protein SAMN05661008_00664 [[Clostridium] paradoxum JW-YL-7 = DSM 7308]